MPEVQYVQSSGVPFAQSVVSGVCLVPSAVFMVRYIQSAVLGVPYSGEND